MTPSLQTFGTSVLMVLSAVLVSARVAGQPSMQQSTDVPQDWHVYPGEELKSATASDHRCFNYSRREWRVTVEDGEAQVTEKRKVQDETPALPARLVHQQGMTGLRSATRFSDEWLLAYDGGEFGGGLWLTNEDGSEVKRIFNSDVQAVVALEKGVLILSGLDHMGLDVGNALVYSAPHAMNMALQESLKLDGAPSAFAQETDGSVLFITTHSLPRWIAQQYANSMAITADGTIYVGMRMFVLKLDDKGGEYSEEWLLPNDCRKFHLDVTKVDCACTP
jgi:hypothetical protein